MTVREYKSFHYNSFSRRSTILLRAFPLWLIAFFSSAVSCRHNQLSVYVSNAYCIMAFISLLSCFSLCKSRHVSLSIQKKSATSYAIFSVAFSIVLSHSLVSLTGSNKKLATLLSQNSASSSHSLLYHHKSVYACVGSQVVSLSSVIYLFIMSVVSGNSFL